MIEEKNILERQGKQIMMKPLYEISLYNIVNLATQLGYTDEQIDTLNVQELRHQLFRLMDNNLNNILTAVIDSQLQKVSE